MNQSNIVYPYIPDHLLQKEMNLPEPLLDEYSVRRYINEILSKNANLNTHKCFIGAGCAVPTVVDEIIGRGEVSTSYAGFMSDQGKAQMQFEYQRSISTNN